MIACVGHKPAFDAVGETETGSIECDGESDATVSRGSTVWIAQDEGVT